MAMGKLVVLAMTMMMVMVIGTRAMTLCNMDDDELQTCKPSVTPPDPVDPSSECCEALKGADLECLCSNKNSMWLPTLGIDPALALALPKKCKLDKPPVC